MDMYNIHLISREQLAILNRRGLNYPLAVAEKDYLLAIVLKIIFNSDLSSKLVFKGGTALHHVYLPQLRFSEDLDFSSNAIKIGIDEIRSAFLDYDFLEIKKHYISVATVKIERLKFSGPLSQENSLKIDVDFLQNVALPPLKLNYVNAYGVNTKVRVMDVREIMAEKIRAMNDRARYRDFYDFVITFKKLKINIDEILDLVRIKEVIRTISPKNILNNWTIAKQDRQSDLQTIHYTEKLSDKEVEDKLKILKF